MSQKLSLKQSKKIFTVRSMCLIGILSALAAIVMLFQFPFWFAPSFYKFDLSDIIVLMGAFALGPIEGIVIQLLKVVINTLAEGTSTGYIGEVANFFGGCFYIIPAAGIYHLNKSRKNAIIGLIAGVLTGAAANGLFNYFVTLPAFSFYMGIPVSAFVGMGAKINGNIDSLFKLIIFATIPFNLLKCIICSLITFFLYKRLRPILHK